MLMCLPDSVAGDTRVKPFGIIYFGLAFFGIKVFLRLFHLFDIFDFSFGSSISFLMYFYFLGASCFPSSTSHEFEANLSLSSNKWL